MRKKISVLICFVMILFLATGCSITMNDILDNKILNIKDDIINGKDDNSQVKLLSGMNFATSLNDVSDAINSLTIEYDDRMRYMVDGNIIDLTTDDSASFEPTNESGADTEETKNYSDTNVQVEGVMEADIVKTDGNYIYMIASDRLLIFEANEDKTELLSDTPLISEEKDHDYNYPIEMYLYDNKIAIISAGWFHDSLNKFDNFHGEDITTIDIYDVTNQENPKFISTSGQNGYYNTSRMLDNELYLITNYRLNEYDEGVPESFMPKLMCNGEITMIDPTDVCIMPTPSYSHTVVSLIDSNTGALEGTISLLGDSSTVYMNGKNLYLASSNYIIEESESRIEGQYEVIDNKSTLELGIVRIQFEDGPKISATGTVPGRLLNQFSMDEYNGYFRVVTTNETYLYSVYGDEGMGFSNMIEHESTQTNGVYVLDRDLNIVGKIDELAEDERVYSVRFDGYVGYFVTFRETDPLFTVDLTDPTNPLLQSELKIPGFSTYLQVYSDGRLFGIGMDADENTGQTNGLKLSMFDTSNPFDVTEMHKEITEEYGSEALYNHKAILIAPEKDIIGFSSWEKYFIYGYSDEEGFYLRNEIDLASSEFYNNNMRGLYIEDNIYLTSDKIMIVISLESMKVVTSLKY